MLRRSLSAIIAAIMAFTVLPAGVRAEEETINEENVLSEEQASAKAETAEPQDEERSTEGEAYAVLTDEGDLIFFRSNDTYTIESTGTFTDIKGNEYTGTVFTGIETLRANDSEDIPWNGYSMNIKSSKVADGQKIAPVSTAFWFSSCNILTSLDVSGFDTGNVTDMSYMFYRCSSLTRLNLSGFDTGNVTDMSCMFNVCSSLSSLNVSSFDTSNVMNMSYMFGYCEKLEKLDVSSFDTGNVTDMKGMLYDCTNLTSLDVSGFNTGNVTDMTSMFEYCEKLEKLDVSGFDTGNVTSMSGMFYYCSGLTRLDLSSFDTSNVVDMPDMFYYCYGLTSLDLSGFDTVNAMNISGMFGHCYNLRSLDLSGFDTSNVLYMMDMFNECDRLVSITLGEKFTKWADYAYLPEGTWKKGELAKTETELYDEYPSHAQEWAGTWKREEDAPTSIELNVTDAPVGYGGIMPLVATVKPVIAKDKRVFWESADEKIATVNSDGVVTGESIGVTTITARTVNNLTATCKIRVLFTDVYDPKHYFYQPVYWALENKITVGAGGPGKFSPAASCTREQFVTFLWRLRGEPEPEEGYTFSDVPESAWYYKSISWAAENGITTGLNDGTNRFGVGQACTREQCVTFLHRAAGSPEPTGSIEFTDSPEGRYYYKAIKWAASKGITVGLNDGTGRFGVGQKCTRGMLVTFLYRSVQAQ